MADARYPADLLYHAEHDWARVDEGFAVFGITWYGQDSLGEIVFIEPPKVRATVTRGEPYAEIESVKAVSEVIAPLSGEIVEVNSILLTRPEAINSDPYGIGWIARVRINDPDERWHLLDAAGYEATLS